MLLLDVFQFERLLFSPLFKTSWMCSASLQKLAEWVGYNALSTSEHFLQVITGGPALPQIVAGIMWQELLNSALPVHVSFFAFIPLRTSSRAPWQEKRGHWGQYMGFVGRGKGSKEACLWAHRPALCPFKWVNKGTKTQTSSHPWMSTLSWKEFTW